MKNGIIKKFVILLLAISITATVGFVINRTLIPKDVSVQKQTKDAKRFKVEIKGEVKNEGVYSVEEGTRVCDVIYASGGITKRARLENVDLSAIVTEGTVITIPSSTYQDGILPAININTADENALGLIPGIGPKIAKRIVDYRDKNGEFSDISDIKRVNGIGEKKYSEIKDYIITEETQK